MSAQYTPYRNEDGTETDPVNWGDQEIGDVEIYQKTTEDIRVVSNKNLIVGGIGIAIIGALLGLLVGYFAHSEHAECVPSLAVALHSVQEENPYIRKKILEMVNKEEIKGYVKAYSSDPHLAGSSENKLYAKQIKNEWLKNGLDKVDVVDYEVLLSYPDQERPNVIKVIDNQKNVVMVMESKHKMKMTPPFSAYSIAGNVSGDLVFVNYGRLNDLQHLKKLHVDLEGKILIARQLYLTADEQAWNAMEFKAAGLILYPDPESYNPPAYNATPYPKSWWLPSTAARTDSILWNVVGDPQTPGYPAKNGATRLTMQSLAIPQIPVQPISYSFAYKLLSSLGGDKAPSSWKGGFNFSYNVGPNFKNPSWKIVMEINNKYENKTISNVIGYIRGKTEPDRYVLIGSHRDAWGYGAVDSASGTAALLELSRVFGVLLKQGWRPRRTIMFCSWGAEEYNLIGSTEWLEENHKLLHGRAVAYINTDILVSGNSSVSVAASPLLYNAIFNATKEVDNPNDEERNEGLHTVYDAWLFTFPHKRNSSKLLFPDKAHSLSFNDYEDLEPYHAMFKNRSNLLEAYIKSSMQGTRPQIRKMDMRSNYAPFFVQGGIPAVDVTYVTDSKLSPLAYPLYHTEYDDFNLIKNFIDPSFEYHSTVIKILGEMLRDLSDSLFLPFNLFDYAQILQDFYSNLQANDKSVFESLGVDLLQLEYAVKNFTEASFQFHSNQETADLSDPMAVRRINDQLLLLERAFLDPNGLPRNVFKRHIVMSPSESIFPVDDIFPGLIDELSNLVHNPKDNHSKEILRTHFSLLVFTVHSAASAIRDV